MASNSQRPLFCHEVLDSTTLIPQILEVLCKENEISCLDDAIVIAFHVLMLELQFIPQNLQTAELCKMPLSWKQNEKYQLSYTHPFSCNIVIDITCIKLATFIAVHGNINHEHETSNGEYNYNFLLKDYIIINPISGNTFDGYKNLPELSRCFKDYIAFPLLLEAQERAGIKPVCGFSALPIDIKMHIILFLDAQSLLSLGCVNTELNELTNIPKFWKYLLKRDFLNVAMPIDDSYKEKYKAEYLKRKSQQIQQYVIPELIPYPLGPIPLPQPFRNDPDLLPNFRFRIPPEVRNVFPQFNPPRRFPNFPRFHPTFHL